MSSPLPRCAHSSLFPNDQVDIYAGVDSEVGDFLNNAGRAVNVDDSLVDAHLESVPGLGTLTARRLTGGDLEDLGRDADGSLGLVALVLRAGNDLSACSFEGLGLSASEGHSDSLDLFVDLLTLDLFLLDVCHYCSVDKFPSLINNKSRHSRVQALLNLMISKIYNRDIS
ncbi:hypothetical protein FGO68_gene12968 [Halteria grandinella]|uniref:Uncharacterized protein n=1 Tax=Halteria grandinella TaxID=5974 RepID=A0A8J8T9K1_HALGN|nr:hypothetical protein FGO68_gene12968 [Halteria grandinella]